LLYTSEREITKESVLNLSKEAPVVVEVQPNPFPHEEPIILAVYHPSELKRQVVKPIYRVESQRTVELFKD